MTIETFLILAKFMASYYCDNNLNYVQGDVQPIIAQCKELLYDCMIDEGPGSFNFCSKHWRD